MAAISRSNTSASRQSGLPPGDHAARNMPAGSSRNSTPSLRPTSLPPNIASAVASSTSSARQAAPVATSASGVTIVTTTAAREDEMPDAAVQAVARHRRTVGTRGGKIRRPVADIGHLAARATEASGIGIRAHEVNHVPARLLVQRDRERRHDLTDAIGDPPVEVAIGVGVDVVGSEV